MNLLWTKRIIKRTEMSPMQKNVIDGTTQISSYLNIYPLIDKSTLMIDGTKISLTSIFFDFSNKNISNISDLY